MISRQNALKILKKIFPLHAHEIKDDKESEGTLMLNMKRGRMENRKVPKCDTCGDDAKFRYSEHKSLICEGAIIFGDCVCEICDNFWTYSYWIDENDSEIVFKFKGKLHEVLKEIVL